MLRVLSDPFNVRFISSKEEIKFLEIVPWKMFPCRTKSSGEEVLGFHGKVQIRLNPSCTTEINSLENQLLVHY